MPQATPHPGASLPRGVDGFVLPSHLNAPGGDYLPGMYFPRQPIYLRKGEADWRPMPPTLKQLQEARRSDVSAVAQPMLRALIVIVTGGPRGPQLLHNSSLSQTCVLPTFECIAYTDTDSTFDAPKSMRVVKANEYLSDPRLPPIKKKRQCCKRGFSFFCDEHRAATLPSQSRFLPALAHARKLYQDQNAWAEQKLAWLIQVDDDAIVNPMALRRVLENLKPSSPMYLGDFGEWTYSMEAGKSRINLLNESLRQDELAWSPPYACGGSGTIFSFAAVLKMDFFRCAARYQVGCYQADWMIGRCAAEARVLPMTGMESCGLCLSCNTFAHMQRRRALARLRNDKLPPCFALTTCDQHLPVPLLYELCLILPRRTPIMHGWHKMCAGVLSGPSWPTFVTGFSSSPMPLTAGFRRMHLTLKQQYAIKEEAGVKQLEDLLDLLPEDLESLGFDNVTRDRVLSTVWDGGPRHSMINPLLRNSTPLWETIDGMRLQSYKKTLQKLGVHQASDYFKLTDADLKRHNMSLVERRRFAAAKEHLASGRASKASTSADQLLVELRRDLNRTISSTSGRIDDCDCKWAKTPDCPTAKSDDGTRCWAICCPNRGPRFGVYARSIGGVKRRVKHLKGGKVVYTTDDMGGKLRGAPVNASLNNVVRRVIASRSDVRKKNFCDCSWTRGPTCTGQKDDGTECWALCCPSRGPRFGDWRLSVEDAKRAKKGATKAILRSDVLPSAKSKPQGATGSKAAAAASTSSELQACDCSWTGARGPMCRNQMDDGSRCWAVCCPFRPPRYGNWTLDFREAQIAYRRGKEAKRRERRENEGVEIADVAAPSRATGRSPLLKYLEDVNDGLYSWLSRKPA